MLSHSSHIAPGSTEDSLVDVKMPRRGRKYRNTAAAEAGAKLSRENGARSNRDDSGRSRQPGEFWDAVITHVTAPVTFLGMLFASALRDIEFETDEVAIDRLRQSISWNVPLVDRASG